MAEHERRWTYWATLLVAKLGNVVYVQIKLNLKQHMKGNWTRYELLTSFISEEIMNIGSITCCK